MPQRVPGTLDAPSPRPRRFRRLLRKVARAILPSCLRLSRAANASVRFGSLCSALHRPTSGGLTTATTASADFCLVPHDALRRRLAFRQTGRSPVVRRDDLRSRYLSHLRWHPPCERGALSFTALSPGCLRLVCTSCSSGRSFAYSFLQTPPRGGSPCCSARGSCHKGPQRTCTSKSSCHARRHQKQRAACEGSPLGEFRKPD